MEDRKRLFCGLLAGIIFIIVAFILLEGPNWYTNSENPLIQNLYFRIFAVISAILGSAIFFAIGESKGRSNYEVKIGIKYKVLSIVKYLKKSEESEESEEYICFLLQEEGKNKRIINYTIKSLWISNLFPELKEGSIIIFEGRTKIFIPK
ncbi:MAG: hypothetical protein NTU58_03320 [Candidatus Nealsonbacteria bacterium]|nr:hypothetical protein [Candidatus Nealsonbacteria bacterium]